MKSAVAMAPNSRRKVVTSPEMPQHLKESVPDAEENPDLGEKDGRPDDPDPNRRSRSRSRSRSKTPTSESENPRRRKRHRHRETNRSRSRSRSYSPPRRSAFDSSQMQSMINASISNALLPLQQQLIRISSSGNDSASLQSLREQQRLLSIETQSAALATPGGKSQYRYLARIQLFIDNATEALEKLENGESDIESVRQHLSSASAFTSERLGMILKADAEPKFGWKALNLYEEKIRQSKTPGCSTDPETNKTWANCLKAAQDAPKKAPAKPNHQPFRPKPVSQSGRNPTPGCITLSLKEKMSKSFSFQVISTENKISLTFNITFLVQVLRLVSPVVNG